MPCADSLTAARGARAKLEANPLENISNTQRITAAVINGKLLSRESLDKKLADAEAQAAKK